MTNDDQILPWYKQGWPWALIAIPFFTVVAGVITFIIANDTTDSLVQDDYYKHGLSINQNIGRTQKAIELGVTVKVSIDKESNLIIANLMSINSVKPDELVVYFSHPTQKSKDKTFTLSNLSGGEYVGSIDSLAEAFWHILLEDAEQKWIIKSRWLYPEKKELIIEPASI